MTVILSDGYLDNGLDGVEPWKSRILYDQIARRDDASISASSTDSDEAYVDAPVSDQTWEWWRATSQPATWTVTTGSSVTVSAVGIAAHDIGSQGATVEVQQNGSTIISHTPSDDAPLIFLFEPVDDTEFSIRLDGGDSPPRIGVCYIGKALSMVRPVQWSGHTPSRFNVNLTKRASTSERGQRLGTSIIREGFSAEYNVENLPEEWVREYFEPFARSAWRYGYFVAWRPVDFPEDADFSWSDDPIVPENSGPGLPPRKGGDASSGRRMSVSWSARVYGGHVTGIPPWGAL